VKILDIGCGRNKAKGAIGMDRVKLDGVDIVQDLNALPYPFADNEFDEVRAIHVIEHLDSVVKAMEEIYRILKPGGRAIIITPHYSDSQSWNDPTHKWHLTSYSFRYFEPGYATNYYTQARFTVESLRIDLARIWRIFGFQFLLNASIKAAPLHFIRKFWENYLCLIIRAQAMTFVLRAVKEG
jgi:SAM-dependent methyltransferase